KRRVAMRAARTLAVAERQLAWASGMRRFYLEGPNLLRPRVIPPGYPSPDSLTRIEESLAGAIADFTRRMAAGAPDLIDRSYQHAWRPNMIDRAQTNRAEVWRLLSWSERLGPSMQTALNATGTSRALQALEGKLAGLSRTRDSLRLAHEALREKVAGEAIAQALAGIRSEEH